jgi:hypothetical protein
MSRPPSASAERVFVVIDNGSAHRGQRSIDRLQGAWPNLIVVHTPVHASWLNQAEIYFSVVQRKVLQPNDFGDLAVLEQRLLAFGRHYEQIATPFQWKFTRRDLDRLLTRSTTPPNAASSFAPPDPARYVKTTKRQRTWPPQSPAINHRPPERRVLTNGTTKLGAREALIARVVRWRKR